MKNLFIFLLILFQNCDKTKAEKVPEIEANKEEITKDKPLSEVITNLSIDTLPIGEKDILSLVKPLMIIPDGQNDNYKNTIYSLNRYYSHFQFDHYTVNSSYFNKNYGLSYYDVEVTALIAKGYGESSKTFTVIDVDGKEVLQGGLPGNTDKGLSQFKKSPANYMIEKAPSIGYYVFIGAVDADFHSFTILLNKSEKENRFTFIDQYGIIEYNIEEIDKALLGIVDGYKSNFPMMLELYQLRNNSKHENI